MTSSPTASAGMETNQMLFTSCMGARGWSLQDKKQADDNREANRIKQEKYNEAQNIINDKFKTICAEPEYADFYKKTGCAVSEITFAHLADNSKMSASEREVVIKVQSELSK